MEKLLEFLKLQKLLVLASHEGDDLWLANVYFGIDDDFKIYFISPETSKHSQQILNNPKIAFSVAWFNPENHQDRKAIQGLGKCRIAQNEEEIVKGVKLHNKNFPEFADRITVDWIHNNEYKSWVWVIEPEFMKFWNDGLYGDDETEEFDFSNKKS